MEFKAQFHQLGKITHADITVKPLTVIAGENGCGKSFVTKSLYSVLGALNEDHVARVIASALNFVMVMTGPLKAALRNPSAVDRKFIDTLDEDILPGLKELLSDAELTDFHQQQALLERSAFSFDDVVRQIDAYIEQRHTVKKMEQPLNVLVEIRDMLLRTRTTLESHSDTVARGISESLKDNFKKNFQVRDLKSIIYRASEKPATIHLDGIGQMSIGQGDELAFTFDAQGIDEIQRLDHIIFIDSPVYLKIRKGLERRVAGLLQRHFDRYLKGYPQHVDDLYQYLDREYIDTPAFAQLSAELQALVAGKLVIGKAGEIDYEEEGGNKIPLALTAMGISNLGLIELLIRNNIIKPGAFLIIDEPEAHLHPKWQVALMDVLYKIARAGANVILATHSIDMIKKIEVLLKTDEDAKDFIALNPMPFAPADMAKTELEKSELILQQLSAPFYEMYMESL